MVVTLHDEKIRAELQPQLSERQLLVLLARLRGERQRDIATSLQLDDTAVSRELELARTTLGVNNDVELAYVAYERGYVTIDEGAG